MRNPSYYGVMFQHTVPGFTPDDDARRLARQVLDVLGDQVARAVDAGGSDADTTTVTLAVWAVCHGITSLEIDGALPPVPDPDAFFETSVRAVLAGLGITPR